MALASQGQEPDQGQDQGQSVLHKIFCQSDQEGGRMRQGVEEFFYYTK